MNPQTSDLAKSAGELTGRKVLAWILGFFGLIIGVNGIMIYFAISTFSGVETEDAYRKGRDYNLILEAAASQERLGWNANINLEASMLNAALLTVTMVDEGGGPLKGLVVSATIRRPTTDRFDTFIVLQEKESGTYQGSLDLPARGNWLIEMEAKSEEGEVFRLTDRVFVKS